MSSNANELAFALDYSEGRAAFLEHASAAGATISTYPLPGQGASDTELFIDCAYLGATPPKILTIVTSGVHGVETPAGGVLQRLWLAEFADHLPPDAGVLFVHALNPFGYANGHRTNENNVDLNRNALAAFPGPRNAAYRPLDGWLNPTGMWKGNDAFYFGLLARAFWYGPAKLQQAIAGGQYEFPRGLFYGGNQTEVSLTIFERVLSQPALATAKSVLHLDLHTGLGDYGEYKILVDLTQRDPRFVELQNHFGANQVASDHSDDATFYAASGLLPEITARIFPHARLSAAVVEFGTYSSLTVLRALRRDNCARHHGCQSKELKESIQRDMRETFCPSDPVWRRRVIESGQQLGPQIIHHMRCALT